MRVAPSRLIVSHATQQNPHPWRARVDLSRFDIWLGRCVVTERCAGLGDECSRFKICIRERAVVVCDHNLPVCIAERSRWHREDFAFDPGKLVGYCVNGGVVDRIPIQIFDAAFPVLIQACDRGAWL